jgi:putative oxygen-independent coproporphyrinogen III oxidase
VGSEQPFGVYVHWPFCAAKCPYCDFNSHVTREPPDEAAFLQAYAAEIAHMERLAPGRTVTSIFFGGGTPSLMRPETVGAILGQIAANWRLASDAEITLEANPSSVEAGRFRGYRDAGVNRLSLGVQSLDDRQLKLLGRLHDVRMALDAIALAQEIFPRMSFDLIYARPGQTPEEWERELRQALSFSAGHLSLYQLTIEDGTPFHDLHRAGRLAVPDADAAADLYDLTQELTGAAGLQRYEVSNHARPGDESRHNLVYWRYFDYAGIGPGAHGRLTQAGARIATHTLKGPQAWRQAVLRDGHGLAGTSTLSQREAADEMLVMGMRLGEGLDLDRLAGLTGLVPDSAAIERLAGYGLLETPQAGRLRVTAQGFLLVNAIVAELSRSLEAAPDPVRTRSA